MKACCELSEQMPERAGSTMKSDASKVVPAPMREEAFGIAEDVYQQISPAIDFLRCKRLVCVR